MKRLDEHKKDIERALKATGRYSKSLEIQIVSLAGALRALALANEEIDNLDVTTVLEKTRYGEKYAPHPAFKVQRDAQASVTKQMKILGLTVADLAGESETDPMIEYTKKVQKAGKKKPVVIKPGEND